jgi:EmrB/QacA subfamily drug resistance transporter
MIDAAAQPRPDPRRWITLAIVISAVLIVALDTTILNVAIPTILRDLHTTLPSLQWVITGYSLTFASLLIIGGRLGDLFGARRMFIVGAATFGAGSLLASVATSVPTLVFGEAVIEGIGASLMMPATLGILSSTFHGRERATAFGMWGATAGAAVAFGPLVGGYLTTNYSWRWSFRINVIVAPLAILGALLFMRRQAARTGRRERIDVPGALLVASGTFLLVFALSEGETYGWWHPVKSFTLGGADVWPADRSVSIVPFAFAGAVALLCAFYALERWKERRARDPLFEFGLLRRRPFRYGLLTTMVLAMGQLGFLFVVPVFLQDGEHLSAVDNGLWLLPSGISIIAGTQLGARLTRRIGTTAVVRVGLVLEAIGLLMIAIAVSPGLTFFGLLPGLVAFGVGIGFASSQLTNVVLSDIPDERAGAASGANTTMRQLGAALGIAIIGAILTSQTISYGTDAIRRSGLPASLKVRAISGVRAGGVNFGIPRHTDPADLAILRNAFDSAVAHGTRSALLYAVGVVVIGTITSFLIPRITTRSAPPSVESKEEALDGLESLTPLTSAVVDANPLDREVADQTSGESERGDTPDSVSTTR